MHFAEVVALAAGAQFGRASRRPSVFKLQSLPPATNDLHAPHLQVVSAIGAAEALDFGAPKKVDGEVNLSTTDSGVMLKTLIICLHADSGALRAVAH